MLALPIFPARLQASIFGRSELNFRVRNGNGWTLALISTNYSFGLTEEHTDYTTFSCSVKSLFMPDPKNIESEGKAAEGTSFRVCTEASDPQLALTW